MTNNKIFNGNELIAEFMGGKYDNDTQYWHFKTSPEYVLGFKYSLLRYNLSWDWLMPVVEKIGKLVIDRFPINVTVHTSGIYIGFNHSNMSAEYKEGILEIVNTLNINYFNLDKNNQNDMITSCWIGVVEFIKWYNINNNQ